MVLSSRFTHGAADLRAWIIVLAACFLPAMLHAQEPSCTNNLVVNGSFSGGFAPWTAGSGLPQFLATEGYQNNPGCASLHEYSASSDVLSQAVEIPGNTKYTISFAARKHWTWSPMLSVHWIVGTFHTPYDVYHLNPLNPSFEHPWESPAITSDTWEYFTSPVLTSPPYSSLKVSVGLETSGITDFWGTIDIDDVCITVVNDPCSSNRLVNGSFDVFNPWAVSYGSPDYAPTGGVGSGFVNMWGNKVVGEAIHHTFNFVQGRRYLISCWTRLGSDATKIQSVRFGFRASQAPLTAPDDASAVVVWDTPFTTTQTWTSWMMDAPWAAPGNFSTLTVFPFNESSAMNGDSTSNGQIDLICIQEMRDPCEANTIVFNTGYNHALDMNYAPAQPDGYWSVTADPITATQEPRPAYVLPHGNDGTIEGWDMQPGAQWIGSHSQVEQDVNGDYVFEFPFCVGGAADSQYVHLDLRVLVDDDAKIYLNNVLIGQTPVNPEGCTTPPLHCNFRTPAYTVHRDGLANIPLNFGGQMQNNVLKVVVSNTHGHRCGLNLVGWLEGVTGMQTKPNCCRNGAIEGIKFEDANANGVRDDGEPGIANWQMSLSGGPTATTDSYGYYAFTNVTPGSYTVTEATVPPYASTTPSTVTIQVTGGVVAVVNFGNRKVVPDQCDTISTGTLNEECCQYTFQLFNITGGDLATLGYSISGGTVNSIMTWPCMPAAPVTPGTTSGTLLFPSPCSVNPLDITVSVTPSDDGLITIIWNIVRSGHTPCTVTTVFQCKPNPFTICDTIYVRPFIFDGLDADGRRFTVLNRKIPASPIKSISIAFTPAATALGGGATVSSNGSAPVAWPFSAPYATLPNGGGSWPSGNTYDVIGFNLGLDYTIFWDGTVTITVHHWDGFDCSYTYTWHVAAPNPNGDIVPVTPSTGRLFAPRFRFLNTHASKSVKWLSLALQDTSDHILAGSGRSMPGLARVPNTAVLDQYDQGSHSALFSFETPVRPGGLSDILSLLMSCDSTKRDVSRLRWVTYDETGNMIASDTSHFVPAVLSVHGERTVDQDRTFLIESVYPNPSSGDFIVDCTALTVTSLTFEIFDVTGRRVHATRSIDVAPGPTIQTIRPGFLPAGQYYIKAITASGSVIHALTIAR